MALILLAIVSVSEVAAVSSVNVPLDHWSYAAVERLAGFGLIHSDLKGTRPYTRIEMARMVNEALLESENRSGKIPSLAQHFLERFKREFREELSTFGIGGATFPSTFFKPLEEVELRYVYVNGEPRQFVGYPDSRSGITASEGTPLVYNNEGVIYGEHHNGSIQFSSTMRYRDVFSAYLQPILIGRQNSGDLADFDEVKVNLLKGYAKLSPWNIELEGGRDSLWWGQGRHGSLLLTNNAKPLDLVKLSNPSPFLLPWVFSYMGPFKYTIFASRLEADQVIPNPWLGGIRINFKPFPIFEMGAATTFLFGGEGQPGLSASDFFGMLGFQTGESNRKVNQLAALDFRFQLPFLRNTEFYAEFGGEDSGGRKNPEEVIFGDVGYLLGLYVPRLTDDGRTDLRIEWADNVHRVDDSPGFWYSHGIYRSGYTHEELIMGHHMDGDANDLFARVTRYVTDDVLLGLDFDFMERGKSLSPIQEEVYQFGTDIAYDLNGWITLQARYGYEEVKNFNLADGVDHQNHLFMTGVKMQF